MDDSQHCARIRKRARAYRENETRVLKGLELQHYFAFHSPCKKSTAIGFDAKIELKKSPAPFGGAVLSSTQIMEVNPNISTKERHMMQNSGKFSLIPANAQSWPTWQKGVNWMSFWHGCKLRVVW